MGESGIRQLPQGKPTSCMAALTGIGLTSQKRDRIKGRRE